MKRTKKILALLLALAMLVTLYAGCGSNDNQSSTPASQPQSSKAGSEPDASSAANEDDGTVHPLRIVQPGTLPAEYDKGIAAVNEKLKADGVNVEVSVQRIPWDSYEEKLNLMLTTGEDFEMLHVMNDVKTLASIAGMGALLPLDDYLEKYPELVAKFTDNEWRGTMYDGKYYAVPDAWMNMDGYHTFVTYRQDVAEAIGYDSFPTGSVDEVLDFMKKSQDYILEETGVKAYHWMHQNNDTAHWLHRSYDTYPFYVENSLGLVLARQDGTIDSFYESEEFKQDCDTYYKMYQEGLIDPDILNADSQVKYTQELLGAFLPSPTFGISDEPNIQKQSGIDVVVRSAAAFGTDKPDMVFSYLQNMNAVSSTAEDPESTLQFLNWLYSDKANHDLFHYGIEGEHYTAVGENKMEQVLGEDDQPLYVMDTWMTGYLPWLRYSADTPDAAIEHSAYKSENYVVSPIAAFSFDSSNVASELTNLQTEIISSIYPIKWGLIPYEGNIGPAIEKLKAAGLDRYLEEYRKQFKAYLDANPEVLELAKGNH